SCVPALRLHWSAVGAEEATIARKVRSPCRRRRAAGSCGVLLSPAHSAPPLARACSPAHRGGASASACWVLAPVWIPEHLSARSPAAAERKTAEPENPPRASGAGAGGVSVRIEGDEQNKTNTVAVASPIRDSGPLSSPCLCPYSTSARCSSRYSCLPWDMQVRCRSD
ncbi:hypothetical protein C8J57DRAFT_1391869, partial [Mycena rebaudengoi]